MLMLVDMGHVFWLHYYATRSNMDAYSLTVERVREYHENCDRVVVCCDGPPLLRAKFFDGYKANREPKPPEALDSLRAAEEQIEGWGVPVVRVEGHEADDVIATLAAQADGPVRIISNDKDLYGLIREDVFLVRKDGTLVDTDATVKKFGVEPRQMVDYLTMVGDTADNIPGCPGVGPGRARDLLVQFDTLDRVMLAKDDELLAVRGVGKKTLTGLRGWDPSLARTLVTLATDVPVTLAELFRDSTSPAPIEVSAEAPAIDW